MKKSFIAILGITLISTSASAQFSYSPSVYTIPVVMNPCAYGQCDTSKTNSKKNVNIENENIAYQSNLANVSTTYTPSKSRTRTNLQNFANKSRAADPAGAAKMEQFFSSTDIIGQIGDAMQGKGLSASNAADVYAVWWVSAWQASRGDKSDVSAETYKVVAAQAARGLSSSSQFAQATDAQKQEMAEAMMIQAAMIDAHMESAAGNAEQLQAVAKAVAQGAKASGLDLNKMELTEKGFTSSDKTGAASDAARTTNPTAAPTAVAAKDGQGAPAKDSAPTYMLLAAIGGASLGGVFLLGKAMGKKG